MKTVTIKADFTGYPAGKKREFRVGEDVEVANDFADMLVDKGLARETTARTPSRTTATETAPEKDAAK